VRLVWEEGWVHFISTAGLAQFQSEVILDAPSIFLQKQTSPIVCLEFKILGQIPGGAPRFIKPLGVCFSVAQKQRFFALEQLLRCEKMSILQRMHFESGLLNVDATGEFSLEEAKRAFLEMLGAVAQYRAEKVLLDGRKLKGKPEDFERFFYGEFAAQETMRLLKEHGISLQFAYVIHEPLRDPQRLGEIVAVNRGMIVKTFETPEEAFEWLEINPAKKPDAADT
jgi:hypothetical protein